jgi:predicted transcriptional regulator
MNSSLKDRLKELLSHFNINTNALSKSCGIPQATLARLCSGHVTDPRVSTIKPIADYFNITFGQLLGEEPLPSDLTDKNALEKRQYKKLPLIRWQQSKDYKNVVPNLNSSNCSDWVYSDEKIESKFVFALEILHHGLDPIFLKNSKIIIEPAASPIIGDYILFYETDIEKVQIGQLLANGEAVFIDQLIKNLKSINRDNVTIIGVILGVCGCSFRRHAPQKES